MAQIKCTSCGYSYDSLFTACPNCGNPNPQAAQNNQYNAGRPTAPNAQQYQQAPIPSNNMGQRSFGQQLGDALLHFLYRIIYFLFVLPFQLWQKAVVRLSNQRRSKALNVNEIEHELPFFAWLKRFILDFLIDGLILIGWLVPIVWLIIVLTDDYGYYPVGLVIAITYILYFAIPVTLTFLRDSIIVYLVYPFRKFLSWARKPAQYCDLNHSGSVKNNQ